MENPTHTFREVNLCFNSYKNPEIKIELWWVGARERKISAFFATHILHEGNFFNICVYINAECIEQTWKCKYFYISKTITSYTFVAYFKTFENVECILKCLFSFNLEFLFVKSGNPKMAVGGAKVCNTKLFWKN